MEWFLANSAEVFTLAGQHLVLAILPMIFGVLIAVPLAQLARQNRGLRSVVLTGSSLLYTIPSLALFIILPTVLGTRILDPVNVVVALTIYAVALLVRATLDAFDSVDEDLRQAAVAMGFKPFARFMQIDLPLSLPVLFAGLRVVSVSNISLVSVAALLGIGNLGMLFTSGLQRDFVTEVVVGIIAILILALMMDAVLVLLERLLTPGPGPRRPGGRHGVRRRHKPGPVLASRPAAAASCGFRVPRPEGEPHEQRRHGHLRLAHRSRELVRQRRNPGAAGRAPVLHRPGDADCDRPSPFRSAFRRATPAAGGWRSWHSPARCAPCPPSAC